MSRISLLWFILVVVACEPLQAGGLSQMLNAAVRIGARKIGSEAAEQGLKATAKNSAKELTEQLALSTARRKASRSVMGLSDDAIRLSGVGATTATKLADDVADCVGNLSAKNSRRLLMMSDSLESSGKATDLLALLAKDQAADQIVDFLWRNKATLAGGTAISLVLLNPEAALSATGDIGSALINGTGEYLITPAVDGTIEHVVSPIVGGSILRFWCFLLVGGLSVASAICIWRKTKQLRRAAGLVSFFVSRR